MRRVLVLVLLAFGAFGPGAAAGQPAAPEPPVFPRVFPQPTQKNGYEELVLAADLVHRHPVFTRVIQSGSATLAQKRALLADRNLSRALALVRQGVRKPIVTPRRELSFSTLLPELGPLRSVGRLLAVQEYVQLADGRVGEALETLRVGLAFARAIQMDTLIQGLVGVAVTAILVQPVASRLDQLSASDCGRLYDICLEWLNQPNPYLSVLQGEWRATRLSIQELRERLLKEGPGKADRELFGPDANPPPLPSDPAALDGLLGDVLRRLDQHFLRLQEELRKEPWERRELQTDPGGPAGAIVSLIVPAHQQADNAYIRDNARMRMLALHAAIRRYLWEHDRLPATLAVLNPGPLARDPFTGEPLRYEVRDRRYTLTSAGPTASDPDDPRAVGGRVPVRLTPDD